jgi:hypothetical protein
MRPVAVTSLLVLIVVGCETARPGGVALNSPPPGQPMSTVWRSGSAAGNDAGLNVATGPTVERAAPPDANRPTTPAGLAGQASWRTGVDADTGVRQASGQLPQNPVPVYGSGNTPRRMPPLSEAPGLSEEAQAELIRLTSTTAKGSSPFDHKAVDARLNEMKAAETARSDVDNRPPSVLAPALRVVNTKRFNLGFELRDVGPSALTGMELWGTTDGRVWKMYENVQFQPQSCIVEVAEEGTHGFVLVPRGGTKPRAGDSPMVWVTVDLTRPVVQIQGVEMSLTSRPPALVIRWTARDRNLGPRPVTISYAESPEGPWTTLAASVPNTGRLEMPVPSKLPSCVLLRIDAVDLAGNVGSARTEQAVRITIPGSETVRAPVVTPPPAPPALPVQIGPVDPLPSVSAPRDGGL